jgi:hypothetical protein
MFWLLQLATHYIRLLISFNCSEYFNDSMGSLLVISGHEKFF